MGGGHLPPLAPPGAATGYTVYNNVEAIDALTRICMQNANLLRGCNHSLKGQHRAIHLTFLKYSLIWAAITTKNIPNVKRSSIFLGADYMENFQPRG